LQAVNELNRSEMTTQQHEANPVLDERPIEVLNFEDDAADALLVTMALQKVFLMRFNITTAQRLDEGLGWLTKKHFDVALLDLKLPDSDGMATFERLRTEFPELPLIVLTGNEDDRLALEILRKGAQDYLLKDHATGPLLAKAIRYAIERHRVRVELNSRAFKLAKALREKVVLLKEIHHRVKNNLQIISSLLNLQSRRIKDPQTLEIFHESCDRVQLMALIHEKLYTAKDLSELDFNDYLHSLAGLILRSYAINSRNVKVHFQLHHQLRLSLDQAIPLGLIASELISNSLKHAFARGGKGSITLELSQADAASCLFRVSDDGRGLPANFSMDQPASLGLRLVKMLAQQINAELSWSRNPATFTLEFPNRIKPKEFEYEPLYSESA
jgi:two-component sensor histidine kinase